MRLRRRVRQRRTRSSKLCRYLASRPREWEHDGDPAHDRSLPRVSLPRSYRAPVVGRRPSLDRPGAERGPAPVRRDLPALPRVRGRRDSRRRPSLQVRTADRERENRERLWEGLREGLIDTIGTDHSPAPPSSSISTRAIWSGPGAVSPRFSLRCRPSGPRRAGGVHPRRPRRLDGSPPGRAARHLRPRKGRSPRARRRPCRLRSRRELHGRAASFTIVIASRHTKGAG